MAEVFKAIKTGPNQFEKPIALKRILPHLADNESFIRMLSAEARLQARLDHPNIVQLLDFFRQDEAFMIALEYVPGKNLRTVFKDARARKLDFPWQAKVHVLTEILKGLDFAHKRRGPGGPLHIVHRDVSPQNVLLSYEGLVKLSDFGIARANIEREQTESGVLKGKYRYLSPEQIDSKEVDHRADLFSAAVVLHEILSGEHPFDTGNDFETMKRISSGEAPSLAKKCPGLPPPMYAILAQAMEKDPARRPKDAAEFRERLLSTQDPDWLARGTEELKDWLERLYPTPTEREEPPIEVTPVLSLKNGSTIPSTVQATESLISIVTGTLEGPRGSRVLWLWSLTLLLLGGFLVWVLLPTQPPRKVELEPLAAATPSVPPMPSPSPALQPVRKKPAAVGSGTLRIEGPKGAAVFVGGLLIGKLPLPDQKLGAGSYLVTVKPTGGAARNFRVEIRRGSLRTLAWPSAKSR